MSAWKTAEEWAAEDLPGLPSTKRGVNAIATREGWRDLGPEHARKRTGRGGGWEYHVNCLPDEARIAWERRQAALVAETTTQVRAKTEEKQMSCAQQDINARRRAVMEARAAVLREIDRRAVVNDCSRRQAILSFVEDATADAALRAEGRTDMCVLTGALFDMACRANDRGKLAKPASKSQIYEWFKSAETKGVVALAPAATRTKADFDTQYPWFADFLRHYARPQSPSMQKALGKMEGDVPSYDQVRRALKALQGTDRHLQAHSGREGPLALKARLMFKRRTLEGMEPTVLYTADGKTFDAEIGHPIHGQPFRPEITTVLDIVTRKIVGWSVDLAENKRAVSDALRHACVSHGIPAIFYTDRGPGYRNEEMDHKTLGLCARLGITTTHSLPYNSQARGAIERVNGSVWNAAAKEFATYIGPDMDREAKQLVHKATRRDLKRVGASRLLPTFEEFLAAVEAQVAAYNASLHSGLRVRDEETGRMRKASPNEVWAEFETNGFDHFPVEPAEADELFRPHVKRRTRRGEVEWLKNHYAHEALEPYNGMDVLVGYDIHDGQRVWVRELEMLDGEPHPGKLICVADFWHNKTRYVPASYEQDAREKRVQGQLRRLDEKKARAEADLRAPLIEAQADVPLNNLQPAPEPVEVKEEARILEMPRRPARDPRNPSGDPDIALAWTIVDAPKGSPIPPHHVSLMWDVLRNLGAVQMMKDVQLPLHELEDRLEAAAREPLKSSIGG